MAHIQHVLTLLQGTLLSLVASARQCMACIDRPHVITHTHTRVQLSNCSIFSFTWNYSYTGKNVPVYFDYVVENKHHLVHCGCHRAAGVLAATSRSVSPCCVRHFRQLSSA